MKPLNSIGGSYLFSFLLFHFVVVIVVIVAAVRPAACGWNYSLQLSLGQGCTLSLTQVLCMIVSLTNTVSFKVQSKCL